MVCTIRVWYKIRIWYIEHAYYSNYKAMHAPRPEAVVEREARSAQWGTLCLALRLLKDLYDRVYDKASGGPLIVAEGDQLWRRKLSGGTSCSAVSSPGGPSMVAATGPGEPILGGPVVA